MHRFYLWSFYLLFFLPVFSRADTTPAVTQNKASAFTFSGYLDGSYNYLVKSNHFISGDNARVFDLEPNGFTLQQAAITIAKQPTQGFGFLFNPILGRDAGLIASYGFQPTTEFDSQTFAIDFTQVYLQYAIGSLTIIGGRFVTLSGAEVIDPTQDTNFSRSILFGYAEPTTHTGVRGTYAVNDKFNLIAGINNGWDNIRDWSRRKTIELSANYKVTPKLSIAAVVYSGQERATPFTAIGPEGTRNLFDFVLTLNATDKLIFIVNYDYAWQTKAITPENTFDRAIWQGIAGYLNYIFNTKWQASLRGEIFNDPDGFRTGVRQAWKEATLTVGYSPCKAVEIRAETRHDFSNVNSFVNSNGVSVSHNQQSYALEGIYKF